MQQFFCEIIKQVYNPRTCLCHRNPGSWLLNAYKESFPEAGKCSRQISLCTFIQRFFYKTNAKTKQQQSQTVICFCQILFAAVSFSLSLPLTFSQAVPPGISLSPFGLIGKFSLVFRDPHTFQDKIRSPQRKWQKSRKNMGRSYWYAHFRTTLL